VTEVHANSEKSNGSFAFRPTLYRKGSKQHEAASVEHIVE
jgi:hypothetical protein